MLLVKVKAPPAQGDGMQKKILVFDHSYPDDNPGSKTSVTERSF